MIVQSRYTKKLTHSDSSVRVCSFSSGLNSQTDPDEDGIIVDVGLARKGGEDIIGVGAGRDGKLTAVINIDNMFKSDVSLMLKLDGRTYTIDPATHQLNLVSESGTKDGGMGMRDI